MRAMAEVRKRSHGKRSLCDSVGISMRGLRAKGGQN
jgi:hypothetical protein